jgi:hypothetical protein
MIDEQELRDRLGTIDVPPTRLQMQTVVDAGRRRVLRRRAIQASCGVALATGVLLAVPNLMFGAGGDPSAQSVGPAGVAPAGARQQGQPCDVTKLPVPAGMTAVTADGVDPSGTYIVGNNIRGTQASTSLKADTIDIIEPILWTGGRPQALPVMGKSTLVSAVNAAGVAAALSGDKHWTAVLRYVNGLPTKLVPPAGDWVFALPRINARGDILATARHKTDPDGKGTPLLWKAGSTVATRLPLPAGAEGLDITDDGTIIGDVVSGPDIMGLTSYAWNQQGVGHKLKAPAGQTGAASSAQGEWASGNLWPSGTVARWNLRTGAVTDLNIHAPATAINGHGWIITDGALQRDGATVKLAPSDGVKGDPSDVSDTGTVVGSILIYDKAGATTSTGPLTWQCGD